MITSLDHIHIYAATPDETIGFYERHFGAERLGSLGRRGEGANHFLLLGGQVLVVGAFPDGMEPSEPPEAGDGALRNGFGVAHFGLQTPDLDALVARLEAAGIEIHAPAVQVGPIRYVYLSAPDGVVVELIELVLPAKLRPLRPVFDAYNRLIHLTKRAFASQLFRETEL